MTPKSVPSETTDRLFFYLRPLMCLVNEGTETVLSRELARICRVKPSVVRKDLSYLGSVGTRGVGYNVKSLIESIRSMLRFDQDIRVAVVGVGNIGRAVLEQSRFELEGFRIVMAFDSDPEVVGRRVGKVVVEDSAGLEERIEAEGIRLAILAVPESAAPKVARTLGNAGVKCILSFAPCELAMPSNVKVTCIDLSVTMARLVYHSYSEEQCEGPG